MNFEYTIISLRPPTLLSKEQIKEIKKNLKKYSVKFNQKDAQRSTQAKIMLNSPSKKFISGRTRPRPSWLPGGRS